MKISDAKAVITVSTTVEMGCPFFCSGQRIGGSMEFDNSVEHLISRHDCTLLHVGSETSHDLNGGPWHSTVAVLGSPVALPEPQPISAKFMPQVPPKTPAG